MKDNEYKCANCGEINEKGWTDREAEKEAELAFGKPVKEWNDIPVLVCDDCYKLMLPANYPDLVDKARGII